MTQGALFRLSDPATSRHAGERAAAHGYTGLKAEIVELLERFPGGATRAELQAMLRQRGTDAERSVISRRLTDLRDIHHAVVEAGERDGMTVWVAA